MTEQTIQTTPMPNNNATEVQSPEAAFEEMIQDMRKRILHTLEIYPFLSISMLHIGIGTANSTKVWRPILAQLIDEGIICSVTLASNGPGGDRAQTNQVLMLSKHHTGYGELRGLDLEALAAAANATAQNN